LAQQRPYFVAPIVSVSAVQAYQLMPLISSLGVDRLVGGDGVEPWTEFSSLLELVALQVHLKESRLEGVFGQRRISEVAAQITK
jgi:hypothetical protein